MSDGAWIIIVGSLVGISCAITGSLLVLRRMAMIGDAISHTVLFGIVSAFLLTASRAPLVMLIGAVAVGLLTVALISFLNKSAQLQEDGSIGVVYTFLFAIGVILISVFASSVDLDQDCVLYGEIAFVPLDTLEWGGRNLGPRAFWINAAVLLVNLSLLIIGFRPLKLLCFDPLLAHALGIRTELWHYLMMGAVSLTAVAAFESVGAILVVAMLVIPANAAFLVARSFSGMLCIAAGFAVLASIGGFKLAQAIDGSISAGIVVVGGLLLLGGALAASMLKRRTPVLPT